MIKPFIATDLREVAPDVLAYIGDGVYELYARCHSVGQGAANSNKVHRHNLKYVSATAQAKAVRVLEAEFDEEEKAYYLRGKNSNPHSVSKNADHIDYLCATGFETVIGFLFMDNREERMQYLIYKTFEILDEGET